MNNTESFNSNDFLKPGDFFEFGHNLIDKSQKSLQEDEIKSNVVSLSELSLFPEFDKHEKSILYELEHGEINILSSGVEVPLNTFNVSNGTNTTKASEVEFNNIDLSVIDDFVDKYYESMEDDEKKSDYIPHVCNKSTQLELNEHEKTDKTIEMDISIHEFKIPSCVDSLNSSKPVINLKLVSWWKICWY